MFCLAYYTMFSVVSDDKYDINIITYLYDEIIEACRGAKGIHSGHIDVKRVGLTITAKH